MTAARDRWLERALVASFAIHALALVTTAVLLRDLLPGASGASAAGRLAAIAAHPWRFRAGWLPWQLASAADLALAFAMVRVAWLPRAATIAVVATTVAAVGLEQHAIAAWAWWGAGDVAVEAASITRLTGVAAAFHGLSVLATMWAFAVGGTRSRGLTVVGVALALAIGLGLALALAGGSPRLVAATSGVKLTVLALWLALVAEQVLRRVRPFETHGRLARWRYPGRGPFAWCAEVLANSRLASAILEPLPELAMRSDVTDVVYVSYLVPASTAQALVPPGLELQRLGRDGQWALFTFLTFRHGHFGFALLGPLRRLLPSPIQTNWRIHVTDPVTGHRGVYFITNALTNGLQAVVARLITEGLPMHVLGHAVLARDGERVRVLLEPGRGSAPDAHAELSVAEPPVLDGAWAECFTDFHGFLAYCVPQDRAMSSQPLRRRISRQEIDLGIPLSACVPLAGKVVSRAASAIAGSAEPVCCLVPSVTFTFSTEHHDREPGFTPSTGRNQ